MKHESFSVIYERACDRKGGESAVEALLPKSLSAEELAQISDDRYLAELTRKVFQSGFVWRVVDQKWDDFEESFWNFDIEKLLMMPDDMLERKAADPKIIRHLKKVWSIRDNAMMIQDVRRDYGSFAQFVADWPVDNIMGLWNHLKKHGSRLGGNTGPYALRAIGKDTFLLTRDIEAYLRAMKIIDGGLATKKSQQAIQAFFNDLQGESGRSMAEISRLVSYGVGSNLQ
ncbi:3-methyladenine DNA glycosylase [Endozoicomonas sp. OPT23]|uniref:DNA-3-methyladenine glycosylase I n=1 Tax=Endozoicomonas sp. OPT23 TaxID=2072845 RepID=UPI00129BD422|nr:DNA-3-methyladenine glycosylase I [Endozoicomonas sp. OPT23]MRI33553.1 3-methyladenine DNA glycosylase [Endozoicomonas sp. OPT23]